MIFYFTGTGNSLQAAGNIADYNSESLISVSERINSGEQLFEYTLKDDEIIGFVFPVYAWGPPGMVLEFVDRLRLVNYSSQYVFSVATCGENIGNTMKLLEKKLNSRGISLSAGFSLKMPNNYIILGNVDSKEVEKEKLEAAGKTLLDINRTIEKREVGVFRTAKGILPGLLTGLVNPLFSKYALDTRKFQADQRCTGCGICEKVCNTKTIKVDKRPQWGDKCTQCLACISYCPVQAIQYGKGTEKKGRYTNPDVRPY
ncbi:NAD(P)H-quinone oxidoreductase subunit I [Ruminiclostridium hungatei]|uniref:Ferredoxin n=1 Tax=Ruminiclostridium hungatei TaxID=48256 RepID=A0A1V4SQ79_RUMHU|nr:EFR1 family ferrodoxin [Ruminiclostridium hungatei]OPX46022.1 NAD(P)H-quinone oxidoreductase subunit I [Ruminiclostridium hungatei]